MSSVDIQKKHSDDSGRATRSHTADQTDEPDQASTQPATPWRVQARTALAQVQWRITLITALVMAVGWCGLFLSPGFLQILAGVVPVTAGLFLGRKVKEQLLLHGLLLGSLGYLLGAAMVGMFGVLGGTGVVPLPTMTNPDTGLISQVSAAELLAFYLSFSAISLIPFPAFGTVMSGRAERQQAERRRAVEERGGTLERHAPIRTVEDLQGLSLPQLGTYVNNLFRKHGFAMNDYKFIHKDKHLDLEMLHQDESYLLRLSVEEKVRAGTLQTLLQEMKRREIAKGLVIASLEIQPDTYRAAKGRENVVLIDGKTLFEISQ